MSSSMEELKAEIVEVKAKLEAAEAKLKAAEDANHETRIPGYQADVTAIRNQLTELYRLLPKPTQPGRLHDILTTQWKKLLELEPAVIEPNQIIRSEHGLPFPPLLNQIITSIFVRRCYTDWFELFTAEAKVGKTTFAVSGTPGIGKSWLAIYLLYRISRFQDLTGKDILYHYENQFYHFAPDGEVRDITKDMAKRLADGKPAIYIIDGKRNIALHVATPCITIYISSPRNPDFDEWCKQKMINPCYFPVWTLDELILCHHECYSSIDINVIEQRFIRYGGIPRIIFTAAAEPPSIKAIIADADAWKSIAQINSPSLMFPSSHKLLHIIVGENFKFSHLDLASDYIGVKLFQKYFKETMEKMRSLLQVGGALGGHLFQCYMHFTFKYSDELKFQCRSLEGAQRAEEKPVSFNKPEEIESFRELPSKLNQATYYQPMLSNFPALDALITEGILQFTINRRHPINREMLIKAIKLYAKRPVNYYFFVPSHIYSDFKKQLVKDASEGFQEIRQYVISVDANIDSFPGDLKRKQKRRRAEHDD